jgi:hypothetical protein
MFPSQQRALRQAFKKADAFDHFRQRTRRGFLAVAGLGVAGCIGAFVLGRRFAPAAAEATATNLDRELAGVHALALGPVARLEHGAADILSRIELHGGDDTLWLGCERLILHALARGDRQVLARAILAMAAVRPVPEPLAPLLEKLRAQYR